MAAQSAYILLMKAVAVLVSVQSGVLCMALCLTGDFDSQLRQILQEQMLSAQDPVISGALDDVQATLNQRWQGYELILCGSLATGLGVKTSDIDLFVKIPNFNDSAGLYVLQETEKLFKKQPELYEEVKNKTFVDLKLVSFIHIPSQLLIELELNTGDANLVSTSNVVRYYFELDKRFLPLGGFLKYFFRKHGVGGHGRGPLSGFGLYMLIIFYLQQKNMVPTGFVLQINSKTQFINSWDRGFNEVPYCSTNTENLQQLLGGFFKYYSQYNFEEYIVSPYTGYSIPRTAFIDIDNFPKEYGFKFNNTLRHTIQQSIQTYFNTTTALCIQDIFIHDFNAGQSLSDELATKFKYLLKSAAKMFEDLPSELILGAMLDIEDQQIDMENQLSTLYPNYQKTNVVLQSLR